MRKKLFALFGVLLIAFSAFGCSVADTPAATANAPLTPLANGVNVHLRDKNLLYQQHSNTEIVTMYLTVSKGTEAENTNHTWEEVNTYSAYDYEDMGVDRYKVAGLIQVGNEAGVLPGQLGYGQVSPNCTVQIRGQSSSRNVQKNYKIKVKDNKGDFRGQTTIALNKHQGDGLRFRNKIGFDLLSGMDELMSLRTTFVRLYVKDTTAPGEALFEDYGIYTQVEQLNKTALEAHGLDKRGHLYKINLCEFFRYEDAIRLKEDPEYDVKAFEEILEIKGDDDHSKLIALLERINDYSIPMEQILAENFDIENISYWMAYQLLTGNVDTQNRNFYLYSAQNDSRWYILPWDLDGSFKKCEHDLSNRSDYSEWEEGVSNYWGNILFRRLLKTETYRKALDEAVETLYQRLTDGRVEAYVQSYSQLLKPLLYVGRDALHMPITQSQYDLVAGSLVSEIHGNYQKYKESYTKPMPFYIGIPQKNGDHFTLQWDPSYTFNAEAITYSVEIHTDFRFIDPMIKQEGLRIATTEFATLPDGQYFIRILAHDSSGQSQTAFDSYIPSDGTFLGKVYGTRCFWVIDGNIVEDSYVED